MITPKISLFMFWVHFPFLVNSWKYNMQSLYNFGILLSSISFVVLLVCKTKHCMSNRLSKLLIYFNGSHVQLSISSAFNSLIIHWILFTLIIVCMSTIPNPPESFGWIQIFFATRWTLPDHRKFHNNLSNSFKYWKSTVCICMAYWTDDNPIDFIILILPS